ncbi:MAG: envelope stress response membrane protein PspC [Candidatus Hydrogenedentota bacterium]|nr:MAG: envelope stress response membrane protein PspC [Candidatus Hydrogenedentota bacterium]
MCARNRKCEGRRQRRAERHRRRAERRGRYFGDLGDLGINIRFDQGPPDLPSRPGITLYRARDGVICGVCKGVAEYYQFDVFWVRVLAVMAVSLTGFWPAIIMYFIAAMVMKMEPVLPLESQEDEEFYHSYSGSRTMALQRLKRTFESLDRRIQRIEGTVTKRDFDWDSRLNE